MDAELTKTYTNPNGHSLVFHFAKREYHYRDYIIHLSDLSAPLVCQYTYFHKDFDGPEDNRHGFGPTVEDCMERIDEALEEDVEPEAPLLWLALIAALGCAVILWFAIYYPEI